MFRIDRVLSAGLAAIVALSSVDAAAQDRSGGSAPAGASDVAAAGLSPDAAAVRDALMAAEIPAQAVAAHAERDFAPVWTEPRRDALARTLDGADAHGLPAARYLSALGAIPADGPAAEAALTALYLDYARDVASGLLEPQRVDADIVVTPPRPEPGALIAGLAGAPDPDAWLAGLAPQHPDYARLMAEKTRLEGLMAAGAWGETVPDGQTLRPGDSGPAIAALRGRLARLTGADLGEAPYFDAALESAVMAFQAQHRLNDDGVVGPRTFAALNAQPAERLRQVLVNLERQRWLNVDRGARHIVVNQADFSVRLIDDGETTLASRVVIGQRKHRSQEFNDEMTHMVVNPTWHVPRSIATEEMLPKLKRNPNSLGAGMQVMTRSGTAINPSLINFAQFDQRNFPFIVKQRPGPANALGRVKFMFPNRFNIYLHDTPQKHLFARDMRAYSHGCIRVQRPFDLAHALLAPQTADPEARFSALLAGGRERTVPLETPVPIFLTYHSAFVDDAGRVQYAAGDIYDRDARVWAALQAEGVSLGAVEG